MFIEEDGARGAADAGDAAAAAPGDARTAQGSPVYIHTTHGYDPLCMIFWYLRWVCMSSQRC